MDNKNQNQQNQQQNQKQNQKQTPDTRNCKQEQR